MIHDARTMADRRRKGVNEARRLRVNFFFVALTDLHAAVREPDAPMLRRFRADIENRLFDRAALWALLAGLGRRLGRFIRKRLLFCHDDSL